jgi:hypothetical protein
MFFNVLYSTTFHLLSGNAFGYVVKYCENYDNSYWVPVKRVIRYLNTTKNFRLTFGVDIEKGLESCAGASWNGNLDTRRSTTGYITKLDGYIVSWKLKDTKFQDPSK